jgi:hypothetical protein
MADEQPRLRDYIDGWADELIEQIEESLAKHAEFDRRYPYLKDEIETVAQASPLPSG